MCFKPSGFTSTRNGPYEYKSLYPGSASATRAMGSPMTNKVMSENYNKEYVQKLRDQYKIQRVDYEQRIKELEKAHLEMRKSLIDELENKRREFEKIYEENVNEQHDHNQIAISKFKELIEDKCKIIKDLQVKVLDINIIGK